MVTNGTRNNIPHNIAEMSNKPSRIQHNIVDLFEGVPNSDNNQFYFLSKENRDNYFNGKAIYSGTTYSYVRESRNIIRVPLLKDNIQNINYLRFRNDDYNGSYIYAWVNSVSYINPNCTEISFTVDSWVTYGNDVTILSADINREHISANADLKQNTIPEGLEIGDYIIIQDVEINSEPEPDGYLIVSTLDLINSGGSTDDPIIQGGVGGSYNGACSGACLYFVEEGHLDSVLTRMSAYPWVCSGIIGIYPFNRIWNAGGVSFFSSMMGFQIGVLNKSESSREYSSNINNPKKPDVKNQKLCAFPYTYYELAFPDGGSIILKPELLSENRISVKTGIVPVPSPILFYRVEEYQGGIGDDWTNSCYSFSAFPSYPVLNDNYIVSKAQAESMEKLIQTQNKRANVLGAIGVAGNIASTVMNPTAQGGYASGQALGNLLSNMYDEHNRAEQSRLRLNQLTDSVALSGNSSPGACPVLFSSKKAQPRLRVWTLKDEYLKNIDDYFTAFGYRSNRIGVPNLNNRSRFNYVKCNSINIEARCPVEHAEKIEAMFLNGVRLWHDYSFSDITSN